MAVQFYCVTRISEFLILSCKIRGEKYGDGELDVQGKDVVFWTFNT